MIGNKSENDANVQLLSPTFDPWTKGNGTPIAMLMSGGVDSSVTALLLRDAGWDVVGVTMTIPVAESCDAVRACCGSEAAFVCRDLGLPHYFVDVREVFRQRVIDPFREEYRLGRTPSPCIDCNTAMKFGWVWDAIEDQLGIQHVATGHYAKVTHEGDEAFLSRASDLKRDQSYFLYGIPRRRLEYFELPLGELEKGEVRNIARTNELSVADRPDSMELCFAGEGDYRNALGGKPTSKGLILDTDGNQIGIHEGIQNFTLGQRRGIGIASKQPLYVIRIDAFNNTIAVGTRETAYRRDVSADSINILSLDGIPENRRCFAKHRSSPDIEPCIVTRSTDDTISVRFDEPVFAPAPGQHLVLYNADGRVLAGGVIQEVDAIQPDKGLQSVKNISGGERCRIKS